MGNSWASEEQRTLNAALCTSTSKWETFHKSLIKHQSFDVFLRSMNAGRKSGQKICMHKIADICIIMPVRVPTSKKLNAFRANKQPRRSSEAFVIDIEANVTPTVQIALSFTLSSVDVISSIESDDGRIGVTLCDRQEKNWRTSGATQWNAMGTEMKHEFDNNKGDTRRSSKERERKSFRIKWNYSVKEMMNSLLINIARSNGLKIRKSKSCYLRFFRFHSMICLTTRFFYFDFFSLLFVLARVWSFPTVNESELVNVSHRELYLFFCRMSKSGVLLLFTIGDEIIMHFLCEKDEVKSKWKKKNRISLHVLRTDFRIFDSEAAECRFVSSLFVALIRH